MLLFENRGLIDETALTVHGVNAKLDAETAIGQFGTGVKYAIAIVLRLGGEITVWRGKKALRFGVVHKTIRGKKFNVVTMNGRKLGYTDQLGAHWLPWMAYRELWSNARDEGGHVRRYDEELLPEAAVGPGRTVVEVHCPELERAHDERHRIILQTEPIVTLPGVEIHIGQSDHVYYRGIRAADVPDKKKSLYTYNLISHQQLTEDRTLAWAWMLPSIVARAHVQGTNLSVLHDVLGEASRDHWEANLPLEEQKDVKPSPQFMEAAEQLSATKKLHGRASGLFNRYRDTMPGYISPYLVELTEIEEDVVRRALIVVADVGLTVARTSLKFKSRLDLGSVQSTVRDGIVMDHKLVARGHVRLAGAIVEGLAMAAGGSALTQLAHFVVARSFLSERDAGEMVSVEF